MNEKAVLLSIQPRWCGLIASGKKTIEVRKTRPKIETPFKCYIYQSKSKDQLMYVMKDGDENYGEIYHGKPVFIKTCSEYSNFCEQKVIGEFICDEICTYYPISNVDPINKPYGDYILASSCLSAEELNDYAFRRWGYGKLYGWHISELKIYNNPKELSHFVRICPEWGKEALTDKCYACEHCYRNNEAYATECDCEGEIHIKQAPQSWCYVEVSESD